MVLNWCMQHRLYVPHCLRALGESILHAFSWLPGAAVPSHPLQVKLRNLCDVLSVWVQTYSWDGENMRVFRALLPIQTLVLVVCKFALHDTVLSFLPF